MGSNSTDDNTDTNALEHKYEAFALFLVAVSCFIILMTIHSVHCLLSNRHVISNDCTYAVYYIVYLSIYFAYCYSHS